MIHIVSCSFLFTAFSDDFDEYTWVYYMNI